MVFQKLLKPLADGMTLLRDSVLWMSLGGCHTLQMLSLPTASKATGYDWFVSNSKAISIIAGLPTELFLFGSHSELSMSLGVYVHTVFPVVDSFRIWRSLHVILPLSCTGMQEAQFILYLAWNALECLWPLQFYSMWLIPESLGLIILWSTGVFLPRPSDMLATSHSH